MTLDFTSLDAKWEKSLLRLQVCTIGGAEINLSSSSHGPRSCGDNPVLAAYKG